MGTAPSSAKVAAAFKHPEPKEVPKENKYYLQNLDGYKEMRQQARQDGDVQATLLDGDLFKAFNESYSNDGKIDLKEAQGPIYDKIKDGRLGKEELTCNERWTIRYALGEFKWEYDARQFIMNSMHTLDVLDTADKKLTDKDGVFKALRGPSLKELQEPATKKGPGASEDLVLVDGMLLDKGMLLAVKEAVSDDGVVDAREAVKIFLAAADTDNVLTRCERWTFRFILSSNEFTDAAFNFLREALQKLTENDSHEA
mmetsp:Transcript_16919/g.43096  ORF Transcript_16919/g.43096 Transcript_16919/m.43096 type:complete len:256 (-) Transcript_16919:155-922(-)|eukprot:CAMPEP_0115279028 /NCGR_PEP_ID=MMETSP0270-20121206/58052_1 /TAXON_ID=71861 /ORGANISM="Scrippsiella trochoidea, Strain CCMP3099" /LENGTH=255 /DNA_ID=CAMNT_0002695703 /DNA_START=28 /DNA_END=795 /DNA_ORIENTATION=+